MFNPVLVYIRSIGIINFMLRAAVTLCAMFLIAVIFIGLCFLFGF